MSGALVFAAIIGLFLGYALDASLSSDFITAAVCLVGANACAIAAVLTRRPDPQETP